MKEVLEFQKSKEVRYKIQKLRKWKYHPPMKHLKLLLRTPYPQSVISNFFAVILGKNYINV